jgi:hypothetical protein
MPDAARVLVVANRTAATPALLAAVRERAAKGSCEFTLLVPQLIAEETFGDEEARKTVELALPLLEEAAGGEVEARVGDGDPYRAVCDALDDGEFDEIVVSTLPPRVSRWLSMDLPGRLEALGRRVTVVTGPESARPVSA